MVQVLWIMAAVHIYFVGDRFVQAGLLDLCVRGQQLHFHLWGPQPE